MLRMRNRSLGLRTTIGVIVAGQLLAIGLTLGHAGVRTAPAANAVHAALRSESAAPRAATTASTRAAATGVTVAVVDSGVTPVGPLAGRVGSGADLVDTTGSTADANGHGTAMAAIVADACPACRILPVRVLGGAGMGTTALAAQGVRWAAAHGARVINLSLTMSGADPGLTSAIEGAVAQGITVVIAAGNSGSGDPSAAGYPGASSPDALTVASVDPSGHLYPWSNRGSWVHLAAPGVLPSLTTTGRPMSATGTSGSAAYVSGLAGRLLGCNPSLSPAAIRTALESNASPVPALSGGVVEPGAARRTAAPGCAA